MNKHTHHVALGMPITLSSLFTTDVFALETYVPTSDNSIMAAYTLVVPKTEVASGLLARAVIPPGLPSGYNTYPAPTSIWTERRFGYAITRPLTKDGDWQWTHYTPEGKSFAKCLQSGKEVSCLTTAPE